MRIADGIEMLPIEAVLLGRKETVYPTLLWDVDHAVLIDTGYPGQWPLVREAIVSAGVRAEKLNKVIITHQDIDHIGSLPAIHAELPNVEVMANELEKPYIQGDRRLLKITDESIAHAMDALPPELPEPMRAAFKRTLERPPCGKVNAILQPQTELPFAGGLIVIETPGHTPGHVSLYHKPSKTLIAADALQIVDGRLTAPEPLYCIDPALAMRSLLRFAAYDIEQVVCYHGGFFQGDCNRLIEEIARQQTDDKQAI